MINQTCTVETDILYNDVFEALFELSEIIYKQLSKYPLDKITLTEVDWLQREDGHYQLCQENYIHWFRVRVNYENSVLKIDEYSEYCKIINSKPEFKRHFDYGFHTLKEERHISEFDVLYSLISVFFNPIKLLPFDKEKLLSKYKELEDFILSEYVEYQNIIPICGIRCESDKISIGDNVSLRKLSSEQILKLFRYGFNMNATGSRVVVTDTYDTALVTSYFLPKSHISLDDVRHIELLKEYKFFMDTDCLYELDKISVFLNKDFFPLGRITSPQHPFNPQVSFCSYKLSNLFMRDNILLSVEDAYKLHSNVTMLNEVIVAGRRFLEPALRRLGMSINRELVLDRFIDLMVCIEILFIGSDGRKNTDNIKQRVKSRCSKFFSTFFDENTDDYVTFYESCYRIRSEIIHGSDPVMPNELIFNRELNMDDLIEILHADVRRTIIFMLSIDDKYFKSPNVFRWKDFVENRIN